MGGPSGTASLPIIDIGPLLARDPAGTARVAREIRAACTDVGASRSAQSFCLVTSPSAPHSMLGSESAPVLYFTRSEPAAMLGLRTATGTYVVVCVYFSYLDLTRSGAVDAGACAAAATPTRGPREVERGEWEE